MRVKDAELERLRRELRKYGVRQKAIAEDLGVTPSHVCSVLSGRHQNARVIETAVTLLRTAMQHPPERERIAWPWEAKA